MAVGLLDLKGAQEWVVTTKLGSSDKRPGTQQPLVRTCRFYAGEMLMSTFVLTAAMYGVFSVNKWSFSIFLTLQGIPSFSSRPHVPSRPVVLTCPSVLHSCLLPLAIKSPSHRDAFLSTLMHSFDAAITPPVICCKTT